MVHLQTLQNIFGFVMSKSGRLAWNPSSTLSKSLGGFVLSSSSRRNERVLVLEAGRSVTGNGALKRSIYWMKSHFSVLSVSRQQGSFVSKNCFIVTESKMRMV